MNAPFFFFFFPVVVVPVLSSSSSSSSSSSDKNDKNEIKKQVIYLYVSAIGLWALRIIALRDPGVCVVLSVERVLSVEQGERKSEESKLVVFALNFMKEKERSRSNE